jgi:hypothetical protein
MRYDLKTMTLKILGFLFNAVNDIETVDRVTGPVDLQLVNNGDL